MKTYRFRLVLLNDEDGEAKELINEVDSGYFISRILKAWAKRVDEPAPVVKLKGQTEMDLP